MGLLKTIKKAVKSVVKAVTGDNTPKAPPPNAQLGPAGDTGTRAQRSAASDAMRRRQARGRDSTIITARSEIGSRTLLG